MTPETATILEHLRQEIKGLASPWKDRSAAAAYLGCDEKTVDKLAAKGHLPKKYFAKSPRYAVEDLDRLMSSEKRNLL